MQTWQRALECSKPLLFPRAAPGTVCLWSLGGPFISEPWACVPVRCWHTWLFCVWGWSAEAAMWIDSMPLLPGSGTTISCKSLYLLCDFPLPSSVWPDSCVCPISWLPSLCHQETTGPLLKAQGSGNLIWDPVCFWLLIREEGESRKHNCITFWKGMESLGRQENRN